MTNLKKAVEEKRDEVCANLDPEIVGCHCWHGFDAGRDYAIGEVIELLKQDDQRDTEYPRMFLEMSAYEWANYIEQHFKGDDVDVTEER